MFFQVLNPYIAYMSRSIRVTRFTESQNIANRAKKASKMRISFAKLSSSIGGDHNGFVPFYRGWKITTSSCGRPTSLVWLDIHSNASIQRPE